MNVDEGRIKVTKQPKRTTKHEECHYKCSLLGIYAQQPNRLVTNSLLSRIDLSVCEQCTTFTGKDNSVVENANDGRMKQHNVQQ